MYNTFVTQQTSGYRTGILSTLNLPFNHVMFFGYKSFASGVPTNNTSTVYVGFSTGYTPISIAAGATYTIALSHNIYNSLSNVYTNISSGDGLLAISHP